MDKKEFGQRLRAIRKRKGYSQHRLAEMMGYKDRSTLAKVETGTNDITIETLYRYADVLETDVEELLGIKKSRKISQNCKVFSFETEEIKVAIREIEKKDYPAAASIWREVLDVPTTDDDLKKTHEKMRGDDCYHTLMIEVVVAKWRFRYPGLAISAEKAEKVLTFYEFPEGLRKPVYTNNRIESSTSR